MKFFPVLIGVVAGLVVGGLVFWLRLPSGKPEPPQPVALAEPAESAPAPAPAEPVAPLRPKALRESVAAQPSLQTAPAPLTKAERLAQVRESFRALAGDPKAALGAARQLTNEVERETALLALVTEWKHGELSPPRQRAWAIASFGLEAGLGLELAGNPELAQLWGSELSDGQSRAVAPEHLGVAMMDAGPAAALAFGEQLSVGDRRKFFDSAFASLAEKDTEAALQWTEQLSDPAEREAALKAIRNVAPVGIGTELRVQDGYAVINRLLPGMAAELSGQLHPGDRIVAVAQGDYAFVDARSLSLQELVQSIRGATGTLLQLQVVPADAPPDSPPRTVSIIRSQIKFKR